MKVQDFQQWFKKRYRSTSSFLSGSMLLIVDLIVIMLSIGASFFIINLINKSLINFKSFVMYWIYLPAFIIVFYIAKLYPGIMLSPADEIRRLAIGSSCCFIGIALSIAVETEGKAIISMAMLLAVPISMFALPLGRQISRTIFCKFKFWGVPVVIYIESMDNTLVIDRLIHHPEFGYKPALILCKSCNKNMQEYQNIPVKEPNEEITEQIKQLKIKTAIIIETSSNYTETDENLYAQMMSLYRYTIYIPYNKYISSLSASVRDFNGIIGFSTTHNLTKISEIFAKRFIDFVLLAIAAIPTLLVTLIVSIAIKITSPGPIFYGHKRIGKNGKEIKVWKFRSMVTNSQEILEKILAEDEERRIEWEKDRKFKDDPRITKIGKILRNTSLDELPQLWNILKGDMSFIGPRPVTSDELEKYGKYVDFVLSAKPGLSGMWQISGRSDTGYEERILLDMYYIQNWTIWLDIWIIIKTIWVVIKRKGAY